MTEVALLFTLDYEIFGDGTGSTKREQVIPTAYLADLLELYNMRLTIFVEVGQQIYFKKHGIEHQYAPVEQQLKALYQRGHDIQLHIHPMWFFSPPPKNDLPSLDSTRYDLSQEEPEVIDNIVGQSCTYLTELLASVDPQYRPVAYRAGAWSMARHEILFEILARHGIRIDSTIAPGARLEAGYGRFDFTGYKMKPYWKEAGLLELPILTERTPLAARKYLTPTGMAARRIAAGFYPAPLVQMGKSRFAKLRDKLARNFMLADFNTLAVSELVAMIDRHARRNADQKHPVPVILIGHSKTAYFSDRLHQLFDALERKGCKVCGTTLAQLAADEVLTKKAAALSTAAEVDTESKRAT